MIHFGYILPVLAGYIYPALIALLLIAAALLRKENARTIEETWRGIGRLLDDFTPDECANYLRNAGYSST